MSYGSKIFELHMESIELAITETEKIEEEKLGV